MAVAAGMSGVLVAGAGTAVRVTCPGLCNVAGGADAGRRDGRVLCLAGEEAGRCDGIAAARVCRAALGAPASVVSANPARANAPTAMSVAALRMTAKCTHRR